MSNGDEPLIRVARVLTMTGLTRARFSQLVRLGLFPTPNKASPRAWRETEVIGWIEAHRPRVKADGPMAESAAPLRLDIPGVDHLLPAKRYLSRKNQT